MPSSNQSFRYDVKVPLDGRLEVQVPLPAGSEVTVFVVEKSTDDLNDLVAASSSSLDFWNNTFDDEDWNNA
jgi:hypothetical protein